MLISATTRNEYYYYYYLFFLLLLFFYVVPLKLGGQKDSKVDASTLDALFFASC